MPTITAELLPDIGAIRLTIGTTLALASLVRADSTGTADVRVRQGGLAAPAAGSSMIHTDYEPAQGGVIYTATDTAGASAQVSVQFALASPWLLVPVLPNYSSQLQTVTFYSAKGTSHSTVHQPPGRPDPVVVLRSFGSKQGTLGLWAGSHQAAQALYDTITRGQVLMLRQPEHLGQDMYFIAQEATIDVLAVAGSGTVWGVSCSYIQVARPMDPLGAALGWTFAGVSASASSFAELRSRYATFEDLRLNEPKP
jgi:hypothetical protein